MFAKALQDLRINLPENPESTERLHPEMQCYWKVAPPKGILPEMLHLLLEGCWTSLDFSGLIWTSLEWCMPFVYFLWKGEWFYWFNWKDAFVGFNLSVGGCNLSVTLHFRVQPFCRFRVFGKVNTEFLKSFSKHLVCAFQEPTSPVRAAKATGPQHHGYTTCFFSEPAVWGASGARGVLHIEVRDCASDRCAMVTMTCSSYTCSHSPDRTLNN